jgi:hypothetical protein
MSESIDIDAPPEKVWNYLGHNPNASSWSVYFKTIRTLNSPSGQDTAVGSIRRCYRGEDETSPFWDELTLEVKAPTYRKILSYNFSGYKNPKLKQAQFVVHNRLELLPNGRTRLTFANAIWSPLDLGALWDFALLSGSIQETLRWNLENIKHGVEAEYTRAPYVRRHAFIELGKHQLDEM